jgi:hypothetical protein
MRIAWPGEGKNMYPYCWWSRTWPSFMYTKPLPCLGEEGSTGKRMPLAELFKHTRERNGSLHQIKIQPPAHTNAHRIASDPQAARSSTTTWHHTTRTPLMGAVLVPGSKSLNNAAVHDDWWAHTRLVLFRMHMTERSLALADTKQNKRERERMKTGWCEWRKLLPWLAGWLRCTHPLVQRLLYFRDCSDRRSSY